MSKLDGLTFVDEIDPVPGADSQQETRGGVIEKTINDKLLNISGELIVNSQAAWKVVNPMTLRNSIIVNVGIAAVGGSFSLRLRKNGSFVSSNLVVPAGVRVMEFPLTALTSRSFVKDDVLSVEVASVSGSRSGYHLTVQFDYSY